MNVRHTFESFVVGRSNDRAHPAALAMAEAAGPGPGGRPLFILGAEGCGKTHLLCAIGHRILERDGEATVAHLSVEKLGNEFLQARGEETIAGLLARYAKVDVLLLDDLERLSCDEAIQEAVLRLLSDFNTTGRQLVLTSNGPVAGVVPLALPFTAFLQNFDYVEIGVPDFETRLAIVRAKAVGQKMNIPGPVLEFLALHFTKNIRQLEGALLRTASEASGERRPADLAIAKLLLRQINEDAPRLRP